MPRSEILKGLKQTDPTEIGVGPLRLYLNHGSQGSERKCITGAMIR
jgi:hypothetical protein